MGMKQQVLIKALQHFVSQLTCVSDVGLFNTDLY